MRRKRVSRGKAAKKFRRNAKTNSYNVSSQPMRGGWRL